MTSALERWVVTLTFHLHYLWGKSEGNPLIRNQAGPGASQDTLWQKTPAPANFMSKIIGTEIRVGHAQRLSKLIITWLEINGKSFVKRATVKFYEHLFISWVVIFSQKDAQTETWMGDSLGYEPRKKSRRRTKDGYFGQCYETSYRITARIYNLPNITDTIRLYTTLYHSKLKTLYVSDVQGKHHRP